MIKGISHQLRNTQTIEKLDFADHELGFTTPAPFERIVRAPEQATQLPRPAGDEATRIALNHHMRSSVYR
jgi:hypothetical protein